MQNVKLPLRSSPSLVEQAYTAMLDDIIDGTMAPNTHLVQEVLASRYGVSRQPIQQALLLLKADGVVGNVGRRGLVVVPLDMQMMRDRYEVRAALDSLAARLAAARCTASPAAAARAGRQGGQILEAGMRAVAAGRIKAMIVEDVAFHSFVYAASGNPMIAPTVDVLWPFLRRAMGEVLRKSGPPLSVWQQHQGILEAIVSGNEDAAAARSLDHVRSAATRLAATVTGVDGNEVEKEQTHGGKYAPRSDRAGAG